MLENLRGFIAVGNTNEEKYNILREILQLEVLRFLDEKSYFHHIAFVGGTALRILYDIKRFSEDLDFSLVEGATLSFPKMISEIVAFFEKQALSIKVKSKEAEAVCYAYLKFDGLLFDLGISSHKDQMVTLKIEVDMNPPDGAKTAFSVINKHIMLGIGHYDLPSLFAGKLHALMFRKYVKGRDFYDLLWFLGKKIKPNLVMLNHAIIQTEKQDMQLDESKLYALLVTRVKETDFAKVLADVKPFLEDEAEERFFRTEYFLGALSCDCTI